MPILSPDMPDAIRDRIADPVDQVRYGVAPAIAPRRRVAKGEVILERQLHSQFSGYLKRHEDKIALAIHADPTRASRMTPGTPDYTIFFKNGKELFIEFKVGANTLTKEQAVIIADLRAAGKPVLITSSYELAITVCDRLS